MAEAENQEGRSGTGDKKPVTLITGATKGIGLGFAREFACRGHDLFLVARSEDDLTATSQRLAREFGVDIQTIDVDISTAAGCAAVERAVGKTGYFVEYLVNSAGYGLAGTFACIDREQTLNMLDLNVRALTDLTARFLPEMIAQDRGGVLNVSSLAGLTPGPYQATYYATKAYVNSLTRALGWETVRTRVKFSVLTCGPVATEFHSRMGADAAYYVKLLGLQEADEVARIATHKFFAGRRVIIPGFLNKLSAISMKLTPHLLLVPAVAWLLKLRGPAARAAGGESSRDIRDEIG